LPLVVDASVVVKLVLDEPRSDLARRLYEQSVDTGQRLVAPTILPNEVINAVYRQLRRGGLAEARADAAVAQFLDLAVNLLAPPDLARAAYAYAKLHHLGVIYVALYVVLARDLGADFWTDDQRLLNTLRSSAPWVRWIGDYP